LLSILVRAPRSIRLIVGLLRGGGLMNWVG
jgi:hypothetical protein